jgi:hypothetical protein
MPADGDRAADGDVWVRIITHQDHIRRGRIHHSAFGGNAISAPKQPRNRPWSRELSGRLRSEAGSIQDIENHAVQFCNEQTQLGGGTKTFYGVMYGRVSELKKTFEGVITMGVHFHPSQY